MKITTRTPSLVATLLVCAASAAQAINPAGADPRANLPPAPPAPAATAAATAAAASNGRASSSLGIRRDLNLIAWTGETVAGKTNSLTFTFGSAKRVQLPATALAVLTWKAYAGTNLVAEVTASRPVDPLPATSRRVTFEVPLAATVTRLEARIQVVAVALGFDLAGATLVPLSTLSGFNTSVGVPPPATLNQARVLDVSLFEYKLAGKTYAQFGVRVQNLTAAPLTGTDLRVQVTYRSRPTASVAGTLLSTLSIPLLASSNAVQPCTTEISGICQVMEVTCQLVRVDAANRVVAHVSPPMTKTVTANIQPY